MKVRAAVLREMGRAGPYRDSQPLSIETLELSPPGPRRNARARARRRALPFRPVGDQWLATAADADGARPRGHRRSGRARRRRRATSPSATASCFRSCRCAGIARRARAVGRCSASRARRQTRPAICSAAAATGPMPNGSPLLNHHLGVSGFAEYTRGLGAIGGAHRRRSARPRSPRCSDAPC